ncbi:MAG: hypothetical protein ABJA94_08785 [Rhodoglobus sp.]
MSRTRTLAPALVIPAFVVAALLAGCSSAPSPAAAPSAAPDTSTSPSQAAAAPADALDACTIVNSSMLYATLKVTVPAGTADNKATCTYKAEGIDIVVQTSTQASLYFPESVYGAAAVPGSVDLTGGGISYGYYAPTDGSGTLGNVTVVVVKGEKAVFVTGNVVAPGSTQDVLNLATAISIAF